MYLVCNLSCFFFFFFGVGEMMLSKYEIGIVLGLICSQWIILRRYHVPSSAASDVM